MRFIHTADLHIDIPLRGVSRYHCALLERLGGATRRAFKRLVETDVDEQFDFLLIAGDSVSPRLPVFHTGLFVRDQMARLDRGGFPVFIARGNHDARGFLIRQVARPDNVRAHCPPRASQFTDTAFPTAKYRKNWRSISRMWCRVASMSGCRTPALPELTGTTAMRPPAFR